MITLLLTFLALSPVGVARLFAGILGMMLEPALLLPALQTAQELMAGTQPTTQDPYVLEAGTGVYTILVDAKLNTGRGQTFLNTVVDRLTTIAAATP